MDKTINAPQINKGPKVAYVAHAALPDIADRELGE